MYEVFSVNSGEKSNYTLEELGIKINSKINQGLVHAVRFAAALTLRYPEAQSGWQCYYNHE